MMKAIREIIFPASMFASAIIGAGMFSLPQVFARSGTAIGLIYLLVMFFVIASIHKKYGEIVETDNKDMRFPDYAGKYLGLSGKTVGTITGVAGIIFTLTIYLSLSGIFISAIFPALPYEVSVMMFFTFASFFILAGIVGFAIIDSLIFFAMAAIIIGIAVMGLVKGDISLIAENIADPKNILLPLGPILFALNGRTAISSIKELFIRKEFNKKNFNRAIVLGTAVPAVLYVAFALGVISLSGSGISPDGISGMSGMPYVFIVIFAVLGIFALITSHIFLGFELKSIFERQFKTGKVIAFLLTALVPILLYFAGLNDFGALVGIAGGVFIGVETIMIVFMHRIMTGKKKAWDAVLIGIAFSGIIYEILTFLM